MAVKNRFTVFSDLPPELRFKIWEAAFTRHVIVAFPSQTDGKSSKVTARPLLSIEHLSIGQSCKEAWQSMRDVHHRVESVVNGIASPRAEIWVDLSNTIFDLDDGESNHSPFFILARKAVFTRVECVSIRWSTRSTVESTLTRILADFPALRTVLILLPSLQPGRNVPRFLGLSTNLRSSISQVNGQQYTLGHREGNRFEDRVNKFLQKQSDRDHRECPNVEFVDDFMM